MKASICEISFKPQRINCQEHTTIANDLNRNRIINKIETFASNNCNSY